MPYRRLPNTDNARIRALKQAIKKGEELPPFELAMSQPAYQKVRQFLPEFEQTIIQQKHAYSNQIKRNQDYLGALKKSRIYLSHFIQVLNLAIIRGDLPKLAREMYGLKPNSGKVPALNSESSLIKWGDLIIKGESNRINAGGNPITNPTIAVVKVRYEQFVDAYRHQKLLQDINLRALSKIAVLRIEADKLILMVWNEVEKSFNDLSDKQKRKNASNYGIVYVFRKNELENKDEKPSLGNMKEDELQYSIFFSEKPENKETNQ